MGLIYIARNLKNNMCYVGKTTKTLEQRRLDHIKNALILKSKNYFQTAIRKYGEESFTWKHLGNYETKRELDIAESLFILFFKSHKSKNGYNLTWGGDGGDTFTHSLNKEEKRKKIGEKSKGHIVTEEHRKKVSKWMTGRKFGPHTEEWKKENSKRMKGNKYRLGDEVSDETKNKMRESAKKRGISKETREKMINSFIGYKRTDEQKKKISDSIKIKWMIKKGLIYV